MSDKLVSVVILTYNNFQYLKQCIDSVYNQEYKNIEIIIGDDGSKNFDRKYIESLFENQRDNIKRIYINQQKVNVGTVRNFNECIKVSNGEIIIPLASDDYFYDEYVISKIVEKFESDNFLIITAKRELMEDGIKVTLPSDNEVKLLEGNCVDLYKHLFFESFISGASTYYSKEVFKRYGMFDEKYCLLEDYPYYLKLIQAGEKIGFLDYVTIGYRKGGVSTGKEINPKLKNDFKILHEELMSMDDSIITVRNRRKKRFDYVRIYMNLQKDGLNYVIQHIKYFDLVVLKAINKISNRIRRN